MMKDIGNLIRNKLGAVLYVDSSEDGYCGGKFMGIRVWITVLKPLRRGLKLKLENGECLGIFRYERLLDFCFICVKLDHL